MLFSSFVSAWRNKYQWTKLLVSWPFRNFLLKILELVIEMLRFSWLICLSVTLGLNLQVAAFHWTKFWIDMAKYPWLACHCHLTLQWICTLQLYIEPELRTNQPRKKFLHSEQPEERIYEPEGVGVMLKKGDEVRDALACRFSSIIYKREKHN